MHAWQCGRRAPVSVAAESDGRRRTQAYLDQTATIWAGERDYTRVHGRTGPLVYPAGHVAFYLVVDWLSDHGRRRLLTQVIFAGVQLGATSLLGLTVLSAAPAALPYCLLWATTLRARNVFVNGLFNDGPQVLCTYAALYLLVARDRPRAALLAWSAAVSIKMSALLYAPAFLLVYWHRYGLARAVGMGIPAAALQLLLAAPFVRTHPGAYVQRAFEMGRQFHHFLSHNWKWLPEPVFHARSFHVALLLVHVAVLLGYYGRRGWLRRRRAAVAVALWPRADILDAFVVTNLVGVVCARSLHYSFYVWYVHTLPWLYMRLRLPAPAVALLVGSIEWAWNQWQSYKDHDWYHSGPVAHVTLVLTALHCALLLLVLVRLPPPVAAPRPAQA
jgi:alpha-1,3-mannosyltransferase